MPLERIVKRFRRPYDARTALPALALLALVIPAPLHAAVLINEVAWMGSKDNARAEWIELTNTGSTSVTLTGWTLTSSTGSPRITLDGVIAGSGFYLLERTSDETVPGVTADQIYTGGLANSGATLILADASGTPLDTVVGGADWKNIGGDHATKETAQRTVSGWKTAPPTPRAPSVQRERPAPGSQKEPAVEGAQIASVTGAPHAQATVSAPRAVADAAMRGAAFALATSAAASPALSGAGETAVARTLLHSPWTLSFLGLIAFAGCAFLIF